ncbi:hypothetical protein N2152v2_006624 [Parachlorella kessleri]
MDKFLDRELAEHRQLGTTDRDEGYMERLFNSTVTLVAEVYGNNAFRRWNGKGYDKVISLGLFLVTSANKQLREDLNQLCLDLGFKDLLGRFSAQRLVQRLEVYQARVDAVLRSRQPAVAVQSDRAFPKAASLKQELYVTQQRQCGVAELDHKIPFSQGGTSTPDNAQLVHRDCNRGKGARSDGEFRDALAGLKARLLP